MRAQVPDRTPVGFRYLGIADGPATLTDYHQAWQLQREVHAQVAAGELGPQVLYVEHPPVYTAGRRTEPHERPLDGTPVVDVDRGGKITYHGPGQLVGYPIVFLPRGVGVVDYVRRIEEALIRLLAGYGIASGRVPGRTGVWLAAAEGRPERKIAAIGIRVSRQTTMHGFALNVTSDLADFGRIVPCGITDAGVTSMADELPLRSRSLTKGPLGPEQPIGLEDPGLRRDDHESRLAPSALSLLDVGRALEPHLVEMLRFEPFEQSPDLLREPASDTPAPLPEELREPASEASRRPTVRYGLLV